MSFFNILGTLLIGPLKLVFEIIFDYANRLVGNPGIAIIFLSLIMNILVLPLYRRADAMQEASRDIEMKLSKGVSHIKKTFSGDERMMILQTYYRQNNYKPTNALNGSISLLLEIPFFMAAYQFLSSLDILNGVSFGPIKDLGAPDGLLVIGGVAINVLPILMTLINVISSALYLKGFPLKTKIQLYGMALFFLVFLYTSPACLVFYWTLNNLFSLVKTIFYKLKNPQKVLCILMAVAGAVVVVGALVLFRDASLKKLLLVVGVGVLLEIPLVISVLKKFVKKPRAVKEPKSDKKVFWLGATFLTVLVGVLIPSTFIAASPQEFVDVTYFHNPLWYIVSSFCLAAGTFIVWMGVFYWLASPKGKALFDKLVWILCGITIVDYMFFGTDLGVISSSLKYEHDLDFTKMDMLINAAVVVGVSIVMFLIIWKLRKITAMVLLTAVVAIGGMSVMNIVKIDKSVSEIANMDLETPEFNLSKTGKNVVVIMLDRAMGEFVPYIMNEKPELMEKLDGFTYYSNVISYGGWTNFGTPALFGGYEYTPVEMNKRDDELLVDKHNEALKLMPVTFNEAGYDVTVCDPVYPNYNWAGDTEFYDDYPEIDSYIAKGYFGDVDQKEAIIANNHRNFFCFSLMKVMPVATQSAIYNYGRYNQISSSGDSEIVYGVQLATSETEASGYYSLFMESYNTICSMTSMTNITKDSQNTFLLMSNDMTHDPMLLQTPDYVPAQNVDNTEYDAEHKDRFTLEDGSSITVETLAQLTHYHANMAALLRLSEWFDYLRENDVYDNTKIILVSDHGRVLNCSDDLNYYKGVDTLKDAELYFPLLMVKDFDSEGFTTSDEFMTNADVPTLAFADLIEDPVNPFTGNAVNNDEKLAHDQIIIVSPLFDVKDNNGTQYLPARWASVKKSIWDKDNWSYYDEETVLTEHELP